ncbi:MAG: ABC transporter ATP-binding protein [Chloroflexi bacterium]|nr:ABC transporter ATP-binding protein [Chloroflexota bacterium]
MLQLENVEVRYSGIILVLKGITMEVNEGDLVALLGSNGAGKTTTLRAISGLLKTEDGRVTDGKIEYKGKGIENGDPEEIAKKGIIQVLEGRRILPHLTVEENLRAGAYVVGRKADTKKDLQMVYDYFPKLRMLRTQTSGYLSGGEQQMLVVGRALMAHPTLVMIDEASLGLAPLLQKEIYSIIYRINGEEKVSILLVEQNAKAALAISDYAYLLENGSIVLSGPAAQMADNEDVKEFYLGLGASGETRSYREVKHYHRKRRLLV